MAVPQYNQSGQVPWTKETIGASVHVPTFENQIFIYWGPAQLTVHGVDYTPPDASKWHTYEPINIPQVIRFIHSASDEYDTDGFPKDDGPPPVDDFWWEIINTTDHLPPFPADCMIFMRKFLNGIPQPENLAYSVPKIAVGGFPPQVKPVFAMFSTGMKFRLIYPQAPPIDYHYQIEGFPVDGFYTRVGGIPVAPS